MTVVPSAIVDAIVDAVPMVTKVKPTPVTVLFVIATPVTLIELPIETPEELFTNIVVEPAETVVETPVVKKLTFAENTELGALNLNATLLVI